jgi:hypothetical protein
MFHINQKSGGCKFVINEPFKLPPITRPSSQQIPRSHKQYHYRPLSQRSPVKRQQQGITPLERLKLLQKLKRNIR